MVKDTRELKEVRLDFNTLLALSKETRERRCHAYAAELEKKGYSVDQFLALFEKYQKWWETVLVQFQEMKRDPLFRNKELEVLIEQIKASVKKKEQLGVTYCLYDLAVAMQQFLEAGHDVERLDDKTLVCPNCRARFGPDLINKKIPECTARAKPGLAT